MSPVSAALPAILSAAVPDGQINFVDRVRPEYTGTKVTAGSEGHTQSRNLRQLLERWQ